MIKEEEIGLNILKGGRELRAPLDYSHNLRQIITYSIA